MNKNILFAGCVALGVMLLILGTGVNAAPPAPAHGRTALLAPAAMDGTGPVPPFPHGVMVADGTGPVPPFPKRAEARMDGTGPVPPFPHLLPADGTGPVPPFPHRS